MKTTWGRLIWDQEVRENQNLCEFGITCTGTAPTWKDSTATDSLGLVEWLCWGQNLVILSGGNLVSCAWRSTARCRGGACRFDVFVLGIMMPFSVWCLLQRLFVLLCFKSYRSRSWESYLRFGIVREHGPQSLLLHMLRSSSRPPKKLLLWRQRTGHQAAIRCLAFSKR